MWPEPPLYPSDSEERQRALELEEYFDEACGPALRRVLFNDNLTEPKRFLGMFHGPDRAGLGVLKALSPVLAPLVKRRYEVQPERVAHSREVVRAALQTVDAETGPRGYVGR